MSLADALAYEPEPENDYVRPVVGFVVVVLAIWNLAGWIATGASNPANWLLAALTLGFEFLAFNASVQMRRAHAKKLTSARRVWFATLAMCSGWSVYSAHHALGIFAPVPALDVVTFATVIEMLKTAPAVAVLTVAACLVPFLPWAIETTEKSPKPPGHSTGHAEPVTNDKPLPANDISGTRNRTSNLTQRAGRDMARELKSQRPHAPRFADAPGIERVSKRAPPLKVEEIEAAIAHLTKSGEVVSIRSVARFHNAPTSRVMGSAGKPLIAAAKAA